MARTRCEPEQDEIMYLGPGGTEIQGCEIGIYNKQRLCPNRNRNPWMGAGGLRNVAGSEVHVGQGCEAHVGEGWSISGATTARALLTAQANV